MSVIYYLPQDLAYFKERLPSMPTELLIAMSQANCLAYALEYTIDPESLELYYANSSAYQGQPLSSLGNPNDLDTMLRELLLLRYNTKSNAKDHLSLAYDEQFEAVYREAAIKLLSSLEPNQTLRIHGIEFRAVSSIEMVATIYHQGFDKHQVRIKTKLGQAAVFYDQWFARAVQLMDHDHATIEEILAMAVAD